ncbi:MAG: hypothetical protein LBN93_01090 [Candidatus Symbiothrix sp.]|jgi:hypothetical protein|nr:hypothetical protein [Candidatus Symbiothrix sp.]
MKKRILFKELRIKSAMTVALAIACVLVTGNCSLVTAQVAIGGDGTVTPGALLDLSQATDAGGLLLPQIVSADTATAVLKKPGMLVYNKTDGKIYAYNGSAWSAGGGSGGSGGGGGEPEPTPSPTSCSGSVMGVSGTVYPIGSYPYAQNDLKNLCWTLTNLQEAGQSYTSYNGQSNLIGYYYGSATAVTPATDVCKQTIGSNWRVPNTADWGLLMDGFADLSYTELRAWTEAPNALNGYVTYGNSKAGTCSWSVGYGEGGYSTYFRVGATSSCVKVTALASGWAFNQLAPKNPGSDCTFYENRGYFVTIRCVRVL